MLFHELTDETTDLASSAGVQFITKLNKIVSLGLIQAQNKLTIFLRFLLFRLFGHSNLVPALDLMPMHCIYITYAWAIPNILYLMEKENKMNLYTAHTMLVRDRMDWDKPHLTWLPKRLYRAFSRTK